MGDKVVLIDREEIVLRYDAADLLRRLGDELARGRLGVQSGEVEVGDAIKLKVKSKKKTKADLRKYSLELELSWISPTA
jgi:amphi-Trp domain-containing protein